MNESIIYSFLNVWIVGLIGFTVVALMASLIIPRIREEGQFSKVVKGLCQIYFVVALILIPLRVLDRTLFTFVVTSIGDICSEVLTKNVIAFIVILVSSNCILGLLHKKNKHKEVFAKYHK
jgi:hypothetical protein